MKLTIQVKAHWDPEARVWYVEESNLPGLSAEAETVELLAKKLPALIEDLLAYNQVDGHHAGGEVPIELCAYASLTAKNNIAA